MAAQKRTLVLVPGSFNHIEFYIPLIEKFTSETGYPLHTVALRTVGKKPGPLPTIYDDAAFIASEVEKLADDGKEMVLMGHSYGGIPISQCMEGLSLAAREKEGKKGGVVRIAYMTALVPAMGENALAGLEGCPTGYTETDEDGWMHNTDHMATAKYVFSDLPTSEGLSLTEKFSQHSAVSFINELTYEGYKDVPASYLFCETDGCVVPAAQQKAIDVIEKATGRKVDVTRIPSDHCPVVSHQKEVVEWFVGMLEKGRQE